MLRRRTLGRLTLVLAMELTNWPWDGSSRAVGGWGEPVAGTGLCQNEPGVSGIELDLAGRGSRKITKVCEDKASEVPEVEARGTRGEVAA